MQKTSYNVIFVYSLLVVDLLVNIADKLIPSTYIEHTSHKKQISGIAFSIVIIQIFSILCVVINLVLHFFDASDQVRQFAWHHHCAGKDDGTSRSATSMPQRAALKLVLDKYWWSLLVGVLYLVVTIVLQIVRLDPSWNYSALNAKLTAFNETSSNFSSLRLGLNEQTVPVDPVLVAEEHFSETSSARYEPQPAEDYSDVAQATSSNLLPIIVLLIHKLMSTCYYVSFVVVYRATPNQILARIFVNPHKTTSSSTTIINANKQH